MAQCILAHPDGVSEGAVDWMDIWYDGTFNERVVQRII